MTIRRQSVKSVGDVLTNGCLKNPLLTPANVSRMMLGREFGSIRLTIDRALYR
jgi:hypothetical protein